MPCMEVLTSIYGMTCMIDGNFGNVSAGVLFSKVACQRKRWLLRLFFTTGGESTGCASTRVVDYD